MDRGDPLEHVHDKNNLNLDVAFYILYVIIIIVNANSINSKIELISYSP